MCTPDNARRRSRHTQRDADERLLTPATIVAMPSFASRETRIKPRCFGVCVAWAWRGTHTVPHMAIHRDLRENSIWSLSVDLNALSPRKRRDWASPCNDELFQGENAYYYGDDDS